MPIAKVSEVWYGFDEKVLNMWLSEGYLEMVKDLLMEKNSL